MSKAHYIQPAGPSRDSKVVRLGATANLAGNLTLSDKWKLIKFAGTDRYELCAAGDLFDGAVTSVEVANSQGWSIGGIQEADMMTVIADGAQGTPGTGTIAAGDYVVAGNVTAKGTALPSYAKVCKATIQPGVTVATVVGDVAPHIAAALKAWRVVSLGVAGTGAVGTSIVIERVGV